MNEWITDRLPLESSTTQRLVWVPRKDRSLLVHYTNVKHGEPWMPLDEPQPYQPPEPDTSLSASIERMTEFEEGESGYPQRLDGMSLWQDDLSTILEAARKWDEHISNAAVQAPDDYTPPKPEKVSTLIGIEPNEWDRLREVEDQYVELVKKCSDCSGCDVDPDDIGESDPPDPDGVGEGWRLLREGEKIQEGDEIYSDGAWRLSCNIGYRVFKGMAKRRRRIDADCVTHEEKYGNVCERGTPNCPGGHDDIGESEHGKKYEERTSSGDKQQTPVVSSGDKRIRCVARVVAFDVDGRLLDLQILKVKGERQEINKVVDLVQVLPDDPDPEWVGDLIYLCEQMCSCESNMYWQWVGQINEHLVKRGEK